MTSDDERPGHAYTLYEVLGVGQDSDLTAVRKAYIRLAVATHPDKSALLTSAARFSELHRAYTVLSNPVTRRAYDTWGDDFASHFVCGGAGGLRVAVAPDSSSQAVVPKIAKLQVSVAVTLGECYTGCTREVSFCAEGVCSGCRGSGSSRSVVCLGCSGNSASCSLCRGCGVIPIPQNKCPICGGSGRVDRTSTASVVIPRGVADGHAMVVGEGLVVRVRVGDHDVYRRVGNDLVTRRRISLKEALCGFRIKLCHLDGREILLASPPGKITHPDETLIVPGQGMPVPVPAEQGDRGIATPEVSFGHLCVKLEVVFPQDFSFTSEQLTVLDRVLPGPASAPRQNKRSRTPSPPEEDPGGSTSSSN